MRTTDVGASAYVTAQIDRCIASATQKVDHLVHRGAYSRGIPAFLPWTGTLNFDWPNEQNAELGRLWLDQFGLISLTSFTSGGQSISTASVLSRPESGPPYSHIELDRGANAMFSIGSGIGQRSVTMTGVWGWNNRETTPTGLTLNGDITSSATTLAVNAPAYVGDTLRIGDERLLVSGKAWADSGQTATLTASAADRVMALDSATGFVPDEELLIGGERLLVQDVAGDNVIVRRAFSGSALAAHTDAAVYWPRTLTVQRAALGTTAAAHSSGAQLYRAVVPAPVAALTLAYTLDEFFQQGSGYARTIGSNEGERQFSARAIKVLEEDVWTGYGRKGRTRAV